MASLVCHGYRSLILAFACLFRQHTQRTRVDNEHPDSPCFILLRQYFSWLFWSVHNWGETRKRHFAHTVMDCFPLKLYPFHSAAVVAGNSTWLSALPLKIKRAEHIHCRIPHSLMRYDPKEYCLSIWLQEKLASFLDTNGRQPGQTVAYYPYL